MAPETYDFANDFKTLYIPKQKPEPAPVPETMKAILQSYPPLSQVTPVESSGNVSFTALLEIPKSRAGESWEVALWHSIDGEDWTEAEVPRIKSGDAPQALHAESEAVSRIYYSTNVSFQKSVQFTIKFRHSPDEPWRWIRDEQGLGDGHIVLLPPPTESDDLAGLIPGLNTAWKVASRMSQAPKTQLWSLEAVVSPAENDLSSYTDIQIGRPWGSFLRSVLNSAPPKHPLSRSQVTLLMQIDSGGLPLFGFGLHGLLHAMVETTFRSTKTQYC